MPTCTTQHTYCNPNFDRLVKRAYAMWEQAVAKDGHYHVTFALRRARSVACGVNNRDRTHPRNKELPYIGFDSFITLGSEIGIHSELACILRLGREDCSDLVFVNIRIGLDGKLMMAKPCHGCAHLLRQVGFKRVFYTNASGNFELWDSMEIHPKLHLIAGLRHMPDGVALIPMG